MKKALALSVLFQDTQTSKGGGRLTIYIITQEKHGSKGVYLPCF